MTEKQLDRLDQLIKKGEAVLATGRRQRPRIDSGVAMVPTSPDSGAFAEWQSQSLSFLKALLGTDHTYVETFEGKVEGRYTSSATIGIGILKAVREDLIAGTLGGTKPELNPLLTVEKLCTRFHNVARQLRSRHDGRDTLDVQDEYDVQDLLHALLWIEFEDVRPEEATPS